MGCVLVSPLLNEVIRKEKSLAHCQAAITHLSRVRSNRRSTQATHAPLHVGAKARSVVQTCRPNELLRSFLQLIEDIDPGAISETILALVPHLQTGNTTQRCNYTQGILLRHYGNIKQVDKHFYQ